MADRGSEVAFQSFAEPLIVDLDAETVAPFNTMDAGVSGYAFDLLHPRNSVPEVVLDDHLIQLIQSYEAAF